MCWHSNAFSLGKEVEGVDTVKFSPFISQEFCPESTVYLHFSLVSGSTGDGWKSTLRYTRLDIMHTSAIRLRGCFHKVFTTM
jgi:hypothetical protein